MEIVSPLKDKLDEIYNKKLIENGVLNVIIMHPATFKKWWAENWKIKDIKNIDVLDHYKPHDIKYNKIKLIRSEDIAENEFEIY